MAENQTGKDQMTACGCVHDECLNAGSAGCYFGCAAAVDELTRETEQFECAHDWTLRPESDTYVCEMCGAER